MDIMPVVNMFDEPAQVNLRDVQKQEARGNRETMNMWKVRTTEGPGNGSGMGVRSFSDQKFWCLVCLCWFPLLAGLDPHLLLLFRCWGEVVDRVRKLWKQLTPCGLQPGPLAFSCMTVALVMCEHPGEALVLIHSHAKSEKARACINTVTYNTVLKGFTMGQAWQGGLQHV